MESNLTKEQIAKHIELSQELCIEKSAIDLKALQGIVEILKTCKNNRLGFSDKEDDDENFSINVPNENGEVCNYLVDDVELIGKNVIILRAEGKDFQLWETDKSATELYSYIVDEIEFDFNNNQK